jgi:hypothetical protein
MILHIFIKFVKIIEILQYSEFKMYIGLKPHR